MRVKLIDLCTPKQWKTLQTSELLEEGYPVYGANGIIGYYSEYNHEKSVIAITCRGATCGTINITVPESYVTGNAMCLDNVRSDVLQKYLYYCLQHYDFNNVISGSAQPQITRHGLEKVEIEVCSLEEQQRIITILDNVSTEIAGRKRQNQKLEELVKSRFVEMFGDPEDSTAKWNRTNFASVCLDMHQGINTVADKIEYVDSGFPILQSKNITSGFLNLEDVRYVKESDYEYYRNKYNPQPNDLLVCNIGTIGKSLIVENEMEFLIVWNLFLIKLNKELVNPIFIKVFIELLNQQNYFEKYMTGGTVKFVNKKTIGNISTPLPPLELQEQFSAFVAEVDKSKLAVKQSLEKLETLKKSLMQQYFG